MACGKPETQEIPAKPKTGEKSLLLCALLTAWSLLLSNGLAFAEFFSFPKDGLSPISAHEIR